MRIAFIAYLLLIGVGSVAQAQSYQYQVSAHGRPVKMQTVVSADRPAYPLKAQAQRMQGSGRFQIAVRPDGTVDSVKMIRSTGHLLLDQAGVVYGRWGASKSICPDIPGEIQNRWELVTANGS